MASWIYVFGVLSIAALVVVVVSGGILGLKGPAWWHVSSVGRFFNGLHLWGVELLFFFMVIHLWGKFFMAAWRGGRSWTWVTGAIVFLVSIGAAFTGYLSQQNFDSQYIATQGKDGLNSVGIGAFFNVLDFGQMYTWHVILLPVAVVALVAWHVLLVRRHGVVPPFVDERLAELKATPDSAGGPEWVVSRSDDDRYREWKGAYAPYDLVKEFVIALGVVALLAIGLTVLFSSPDDQAEHHRHLGQVKSQRLPHDRAPANWREPATPPATGRPTTTRPTRVRSSARSSSSSGPAFTSRSTRRATSCSRPCTAFPRTPRCGRLWPATRPRRRSSRRPGPMPTPRRSTRPRSSGATVALPPGDYGPVAPMMASELGLAQSRGPRRRSF